MLSIKTAIEDFGCIPLYRSAVPGYSIEELFPQAQWYTGTEDDPWTLREILAQDEDIIYAKLFDHKAGFAHRRVYGDLLNIRRDGYDFDTLVDEGRASFKERKCMQAVEEAGKAAFSNVIKRNAGFCKGGFTGFDSVSASLQQKCYLLIDGFGYKTDQFGREYGWAIGLLNTPERRFGSQFTQNAYSCEPAESLDRLTRDLSRKFPSIPASQLQKILSGE